MARKISAKEKIIRKAKEWEWKNIVHGSGLCGETVPIKEPEK